MRYGQGRDRSLAHYDRSSVSVDIGSFHGSCGTVRRLYSGDTRIVGSDSVDPEGFHLNERARIGDGPDSNLSARFVDTLNEPPRSNSVVTHDPVALTGRHRVLSQAGETPFPSPKCCCARRARHSSVWVTPGLRNRPPNP